MANKKTKKKAVPKMAPVVAPYATLTEEQFDDLRSLTLWDNPMSELEAITSEPEISVVEIAFKMGQIHKSFEGMIKKLDTILDAISPEVTNPYTGSVDWDEREDDYEDISEEDSDDVNED